MPHTHRALFWELVYIYFLYFTYLNDIDFGLSNKIYKFARVGDIMDHLNCKEILKNVLAGLTNDTWILMLIMRSVRRNMYDVVIRNNNNKELFLYSAFLDYSIQCA